MPRMISASLFSVRRAGREMSRRSNAQRIETMTMTATTFCIAWTPAHRTPSKGAATIASTSPPVTMLAVPTVRRMKPQKIPRCRIAARGSLNIFVWTNAYWMSPLTRAGMFSKGLGPAARTAEKIRRWRAIASAKKSAAPQNTTNTTG